MTEKPSRGDLPPLPEIPEPPQPERVEFRLAVLDCPTCAAPLDAESADVVFYCTACRNGYRLERSGDGVAPARLAPVEVSFLSMPNAAVERWVPFWYLPAKIDLQGRSGGRRKHQFRDFQLLTKLFPNEQPGARSKGSGDLTFAVPAFRTGIQNVQRLIYEYTYRAPKVADRIGEKLTGGVYGVRDAQKLAHYALITAEIRKPDTLKDLHYKIDFGEASLIGVPAVRHGDAWRDALFSVPF